MPAQTPDELIRRIAQLHKSGLTLRQISEAVDCSISTVSKYLDWVDPEADPEVGRRSFAESGDKAELSFVSRREIRTVEDVIAHASVDTRIWHVEKFICNSWPMGYVRKDGNAAQEPLFQVKVWFARKIAKPLQDAMALLFEDFRQFAPTSFPDPPPRIGRPAMMSLDLMDVHFGKLGWAPECGEDYDLKIAEARFRLASARLMEHCRPYSIEKLILTVGNDMAHIDTPANTTTAGTPQDVDGRQHKVIRVISRSLISLVDYLLGRVREIEVQVVPGNHDEQAAFFQGYVLEARYHNEPRVSVNVEPSSRKYVHWGANLIGYTHGKDVKDPRDLTGLMINEMPRAFVDSVCREWHLAHLHQHRSSERHGVVCRVLRSLSGSDAYHFNHGYVGNRKAAEAFVYDESDGLVANFVAGGD